MGILSQLFSSKKSVSNSLFANNNANSDLSRLASSRVPISIQIANHQHKLFNSYFLNLYEKGGLCQLVLDELMPKQGNELIQPGQAIVISCSHQGVEYKFKTRIVEIERDKDSVLYFAEQPCKISKSQPRNAYRVPVKKFTSIPISIITKGRGILKGSLADISNSGVGISIPKSISPPIHNNERINSCYITLDNGETLEFSLQVKHVVFNSFDQSTYVGGSYLDFKKQSKRTLDKLVARLQREERRRSIDL